MHWSKLDYFIFFNLNNNNKCFILDQDYWSSQQRLPWRQASCQQRGGDDENIVQSKGEDTSLMENTESTLDLAFLTDITGKLDYLNGELQDKDKIVADMMQQVQTNIFSVHL